MIAAAMARQTQLMMRSPRLSVSVGSYVHALARAGAAFEGEQTSKSSSFETFRCRFIVGYRVRIGIVETR